jgi:hypothetical protein
VCDGVMEGMNDIPPPSWGPVRLEVDLSIQDHSSVSEHLGECLVRDGELEMAHKDCAVLVIAKSCLAVVSALHEYR